MVDTIQECVVVKSCLHDHVTVIAVRCGLQARLSHVWFSSYISTSSTADNTHIAGVPSFTGDATKITNIRCQPQDAAHCAGWLLDRLLMRQSWVYTACKYACRWQLNAATAPTYVSIAQWHILTAASNKSSGARVAGLSCINQATMTKHDLNREHVPGIRRP